MRDLLLPLCLPAGAALLGLVVPARRPGLKATLGVLGAFAMLLASLRLLGTRAAESVPWLSWGPLESDLALRTDGFSSWAVVFVAFLAVLASVYSAGWWRGRGGAPGPHHALVLLAAAGAAAVVLADDFLLLLVGWEVVTLSLYLLVATGRPEGGAPAAKALVILGLGDLALIVGAVLVGSARAGAAHPWSLAGLAAEPLATSGATATVAWLLLFVAASAKAGAMPFHSWIPTMSTASGPTVMAYLPGALDKVLGVYLLARASLDWFVPSEGLRLVVMAVGAVTILGAVLMAMVQHDLRRLLSFHAVSQVGYMFLGIGTGTVVGVVGGLFHMVNNAVYKACLFLGAGVVERETGTQELDRLGGLWRALPVTFGAMVVASLAIAGIPPLNGFASKWLVYQGCVAAGQPLFLVAALFGSVLTLASFVKVIHSVFWGPRPTHLDGVREPTGTWIPLTLGTLAVLCVVFGVVAAWPLDHMIGPAAGVDGSAALAGARASWAPVHGTAPAAAVDLPLSTFASAAVAVGLLLGALAALVLAHLGRMGERRVRPAFTGGQALDRDVNRFPGTEFYRTVDEVPLLGPALRTAATGRLDPYDAAARAGAPVLRGIRRLHSGLLTDYLVWCLLGLVVVLAVLLWN